MRNVGSIGDRWCSLNDIGVFMCMRLCGLSVCVDVLFLISFVLVSRWIVWLCSSLLVGVSDSLCDVWYSSIVLRCFLRCVIVFDMVGCDMLSRLVVFVNELVFVMCVKMV